MYISSRCLLGVPRPAALVTPSTRISAARSSDLSTATSSHPTYTLPNGLEVAYISARDVPFLYREIYEEHVYETPPLQLRPGDTVMDVGANIGMFSMYAAERVGPQGRVISLEPIPDTYDVLQYNVVQHAEWCAEQGIQPAPITTLPFGAASKTEDRTFTFYSRAAGWSTLYPDPGEVEAAMGVFLGNALPGGKGIADSELLAAIGRAAQKRLPWLYERGWRILVKHMLSSAQSVVCRVTRLSDALTHHCPGDGPVQLLKMDVERAELEALQGLDSRDWARVQQVAVEVHDLGGGELQRVMDLLKDQGGFGYCEAQQDEAMRGSTLYNVYASR